ncbi:MAG: hypothetical protein Q9173_001136 [Seirophora scorigena]
MPEALAAVEEPAGHDDVDEVMIKVTASNRLDDYTQSTRGMASPSVNRLPPADRLVLQRMLLEMASLAEHTFLTAVGYVRRAITYLFKIPDG